MTMRTVLLSLLFLFSITLLPAQNEKPEKGTKHPSFIKIKDKPNKSKAKQLFKEMFGMKAKDALNLDDSFSDPQGFTHETYQQYYNGVKVEGATYRIHVKGGKIWYMSGNYRDIFKDISTSPSITSNTAFNRALSHVGASRYIWQDGGSPPAGELVVVADPEGDEAPRLAYKFDIYATAPLYRAYVYIDAHSNQFISENHRIHHTDISATGNTLYNGNRPITADYTGSNYRLRQTANGNGIQTFDLNNGTNYNAATDITTTEVVSGKPNFTSDAAGVQAHWGAEQTHKYYQQSHSRNSYNGSGAIINSYVHYSNNYVNAFWDGSRMTYGDGDGVSYGPLVSLDIVGHEITHGVTEYSANLVYSYESGALNESFSDIFGESIENFAIGSNDWQMGTDIGIGGSGAIRSMNNPNAFGDPDTYQGTNWYSGSADNGGVHTNSGVQNKWFYILSAGENGVNDNGDSYSVGGIGIAAAAAIAYRNLTVYLSSNSGYFDARAGAIQAAQDLYGAGSAEEIATANAWYAVGVGGPYGTITYCGSQGNSVFYEWIANVTVGSFSNSSGNPGGYTDFTAQVVNVDEGQSYNISLTPGFRSTVYNEYWKIWIDYNTDGDFSDAGELAFAGGLSNTTVNGTINIPAGSGGTTTRMRVSMKWNAQQTECEAFSYGEVEDYTIDIGGGGGPVAVTGVSVTPPTLALTTGNTGNLTATVSPGNATDPSVVWSSSNTGVATVNASGVVTAVSAGTATITATTNDGGFTDNSVVTVTDPGIPVTSVSVSPTSATRDVGQTVQLTETVSPGNATDQSVSWSSSNPSVASVNSSGLVTAVSGGSATITVTTNDGGFTNFSDITVNAPGGGCTEVYYDNFESGWGNWNDGGSDCQSSSSDAAYAIGTYCVRLRDNTSSSVMTTNNINVSAYNSLQIDFSYYARSMENGEDFWLQISTNGGGSYTTVGDWNQGVEFENDNRYYESVDINGPFTSNTRLRFRCDASGNSDWIYIDEVKISGCTAAAAIIADTPVTETTITGQLETAPIEVTFTPALMDMRLFPNPVSSELNIAYNLPEVASGQIIITDVSGQLLRRETLNDTSGEQLMKLDVSQLTDGFYFVHLVTDKGRMSKKFVVVK